MGGSTNMEVVQDTYGKAAQFIWGGWDKWGAQEGTQGAEMTQGGNAQGRGSGALQGACTDQGP